MSLPVIIPLLLSATNPGFIKEYNFQINLAQKTGTNGPRDLFSAYTVDFFDKYASAFAKLLTNELLIGYDGSQVHESISVSTREHLRRCGINIRELDGPVTVPEFMYSCYRLGIPGCFFGRSHSPIEYLGLKLVISAKSLVELLEKIGARITLPKSLDLKGIYGFLPRTLAPLIEKNILDDKMIHPNNIGQLEKIASKEMREAFFLSLKKVTPLNKIEGKYIIDCRHSMAGEVWELIKTETKAEIQLDNNKLNPVTPDRDPREIWNKLSEKYHSQSKAVFSHDADADRTFLLKIPGIGNDKIITNQEESFTTGLLAESLLNKPDAYVLVQERISLLMLTSLSKFSHLVYATAQGEPAFFMGAVELLSQNPNLNSISGADYTDIFYRKNMPLCMKSPFQQAIWLMHWFTNNNQLPTFPEVDNAQMQIDMIDLDYPQRLAKILRSEAKITDFFEKKYQIIYRSTLDGQNIIFKDKNENLIISSIRPSGTGRYTKVFTEIGMGKSMKDERKTIANEVNKNIEKIILS